MTKNRAQFVRDSVSVKIGFKESFATRLFHTLYFRNIRVDGNNLLLFFISDDRKRKI